MSILVIGQPRKHFDSVGSTNDAAKHWGRVGAPHGATVTAAQQTGGRGRRGRSWESPAGKGVYLSTVLRPQLQSAQLPQLTILLALAGARAAENIAGVTCGVKWPNDILLRDRKIGGILCDAEWKEGQLDFAVAGLGLNVNHTAEDLPERPLFPASSLLIETGNAFDVEEVTQSCLNILEVLYTQWLRGDWPAQRREFEERCAGIGQLITVTTETEKYFGVVRGIDENGVLLVATSEGPRQVVAGDVSYDTS
jgi:BirA family biotin operon repressor/biotin-[acetyl-CoA-carboxylase] ligase